MIDTRTKDALPDVSDDMTTDPETDRVPTEQGEIRLYFNDQLMAFNQVDFQVAFEREDTLDPQFLTVAPPVEDHQYDPEGDLSVSLAMPDEEIAVREQSVESEAVTFMTSECEELEISSERVWRPENGEEYEFEVRLEVTPYGADGQQE